MHLGECLRNEETLSILMESLQRITNRNVSEVRRILDQVLECHHNVAGVPPHVALATMMRNGWKVPPVLPTVDEFKVVHAGRVAELTAIGSRQMVERVDAELQGPSTGTKTKKVGDSGGSALSERPMVGARRLLEGQPGEDGVLSMVVGRCVSVAEVDAAYQAVVDGAVGLPSNTACWRCLSGGLATGGERDSTIFRRKSPTFFSTGST